MLERTERGAAHLRGYGLSSDAHHATTPDPRGAGVERAIRGALADAGLAPEAIGYVNAHATGTASNDVAEWRAVRSVLGEPPISATKSQLGHAQGAAGALELIATLLAAEQGVLLPTLRFTTPRARGPVDPIGASTPRPGRFDAAVCASSAFGGANCSVVVATTPDRGSPLAHPVYWAGMATGGDHRGALDVRVRGERDLRGVAPHVDPRGTDPGSRALIAASTLALGAPRRGDARDRVGLILGATRVSPESLRRYHESIDARGHAHVDTGAFARVILSAPPARRRWRAGCADRPARSTRASRAGWPRSSTRRPAPRGGRTSTRCSPPASTRPRGTGRSAPPARG